MAEADQRKVNRMRFLLILIPILYMVSFGPFVYIDHKLGGPIVKSESGINYIYKGLFAPHMYLAFITEGYYDYMMFWAKQADSIAGSQSYQEYRIFYQREY